MGIWGNFQGLTEVTGGGGLKKAKIEGTSFMDGLLGPIVLLFSYVQVNVIPIFH